MKKIYLIRHGEVEEQWQGRYNGWNNIGLSPKGEEQILQLAKDLGELPLLYSSDLRRCSGSVEKFSATKVIISGELREKSWGKHEGMSFEEIEKSGIRYVDFPSYIRLLDGETPEEFEERVISFWKSIRESIPHGAAVLCHGGVIHQILAFESDISLEESYMRTRVEYAGSVPVEII